MFSFSLIHDSAEWCTIGHRVDLWCEFAFALVLPGWSIVCVELCRNEGKCIKNAFQGIAMTSYRIYHLLVLPLLSYRARWVTRDSLALRLPLRSFPYYSISLFAFFLASIYLSLSRSFLTSWRVSVLEGRAEFESRSLGWISALVEVCPAPARWDQEKQRKWNGSEEKKMREETFCALLGRYLNQGACDAVLSCFISRFTRKKLSEHLLHFIPLM